MSFVRILLLGTSVHGLCRPRFLLVAIEEKRLFLRVPVFAGPEGGGVDRMCVCACVCVCVCARVHARGRDMVGYVTVNS